MPIAAGPAGGARGRPARVLKVVAALDRLHRPRDVAPATPRARAPAARARRDAAPEGAVRGEALQVDEAAVEARGQGREHARRRRGHGALVEAGRSRVRPA